MVQQRLKELGFDPGPIDGQFGDLTRAAVWAFEKLVLRTPRDEATGEVTDEMWQRMQDPIAIAARAVRAPTTDHTEVYLPEQVVVFFVDDRPVLISHMSSGTGEEWCEEVTISPGEIGNEHGTEPLQQGECGVSTTPGGVYRYYRRVDGRPPERARRDVEPGVLQLRHRHPRRPQRAAAAGVARLHPHPAGDLARRSSSSSATATRSSCSTASASRRTTAPSRRRSTGTTRRRHDDHGADRRPTTAPTGDHAEPRRHRRVAARRGGPITRSSRSLRSLAA